MKVSLNGGVNFHNVEEVRVVYENMLVPGEEEVGELHIVLTHEGVVSDVLVKDEVVGTNSIMANEVIESLCSSHPVTRHPADSTKKVAIEALEEIVGYTHCLHYGRDTIEPDCSCPICVARRALNTLKEEEEE